MIRVHDDWDTIGGCDGSDVVSCCNSSCYRGFLLLGRVLESLSTEESGTALRDLEDDRGFRVPARGKRNDDCCAVFGVCG